MKKFWLGICSSVLLIFVLGILVVCFVINPAAYEACSVKIEAAMMQEMNTAVLDGMKGGLRYGDLVEIQKDSAGKITLISANSPKINELVRTISTDAQQKTEKRAENGITVSLGTFSGVAFLSGAGGNITFDVQPAGYVDVSFRSEFVSMGINQTRHRILADFSSVYNLILPLQEKRVVVATEMLVCENVIVGEIPDIYFQNNGGNLNFIPSGS